MKVIAARQLHGVYGTVKPGDAFEAPDEIAKELIERGLARSADPPNVLYEIPALTYQIEHRAFQPSKHVAFSARAVSGVAAGAQPEPFLNNLPVPDEESAPVATDGNIVLPGPDIQPEGNADNR